jgi:hypothetical protein
MLGQTVPSASNLYQKLALGFVRDGYCKIRIAFRSLAIFIRGHTSAVQTPPSVLGFDCQPFATTALDRRISTVTRWERPLLVIWSVEVRLARFLKLPRIQINPCSSVDSSEVEPTCRLRRLTNAVAHFQNVVLATGGTLERVLKNPELRTDNLRQRFGFQVVPVTLALRDVEYSSSASLTPGNEARIESNRSDGQEVTQANRLFRRAPIGLSTGAA